MPVLTAAPPPTLSWEPPMIETAMRDRRTQDHVLVVDQDRGVAAAEQPATVPTGARFRTAIRTSVRTAGRVVARALTGALRAVLAEEHASARMDADDRYRRVEDSKHLLALGLLR